MYDKIIIVMPYDRDGHSGALAFFFYRRGAAAASVRRRWLYLPYESLCCKEELYRYTTFESE